MTDPSPTALAAATAAIHDDMVDLRHGLHRHPELSFQEFTTTAHIVERMGAAGFTPAPCPTETGAVFTLDGGRPGPTLLLRADIDGLPLHETADVSYRSEVDGLMHACGHDVHVAAMVGVARLLADRAGDLAGRIVFVFQPAEEIVSGARPMVEAGLLDDHRVDAVLGLHVTSLLPLGTVGLRSGVAMSGCDGFAVHLRGEGGHGASSGADGNVLLAAAALASQLSTVVDGIDYLGVAGVCSAGVLHAGTAMNVTPAHAHIEGTLRTFTADDRRRAFDRLQELVATVADRGGVTARIEWLTSAPPVVNDTDVTAVVRGALAAQFGDAQVWDLPPVQPSDDVSEFLRLRPGAYFLLGGGAPDRHPVAHHAPTFRIEDEALGAGVRSLVGATFALLQSVPAGRHEGSPS